METRLKTLQNLLGTKKPLFYINIDGMDYAATPTGRIEGQRVQMQVLTLNKKDKRNGSNVMVLKSHPKAIK